MTYLQIVFIEAGGAAHQAGLQIGDFLLKVNDANVSSNLDLSRALSRNPINRVVLCNRGGKDIEITLPDGKLGISTEEQIVDLGALRSAYNEASLAGSVDVVTLDAIEGRGMTKVHGIVAAEYAVGLNVIKDVLVGGRDLFGGRSATVQEAFKKGKSTCTMELRQQAFDLGANAVLGVRLHYSQMSGTGTTMLLLVMSGTAVTLADR